ncbi:MAG: tol-pal system protein YbgF [Candidatus Tectomicrobia bacterium]|uniref:Tol-pal system protein YbgF n=1 Tax=Tectimicrobiota bacterium TaxID=2528274 RepID=A0A932M1S6_UNCTE|nr:tol-pal system protein YbgF [Candidatus Tectomicrobia bacterium]
MNGVGNRSRKLPRAVALIVFVLGVGGLSGCLPPNRLDFVQRDINALRETIAVQAQQNADTRRRMEQSERQLAEIRGSLARLESSPAQSSQKEQAFSQLSARLERIERELGFTAAQAPAAAPPSPAPAGKPAAATPKMEVEKLYRQAYDQFSSEEYDEALKSFRTLVEQYPQSDFADNALYWSGEVHYVRKDYKGALSFFQQVLDRYPQGNKVPDAMLKLALSHYQLKDNQNAVRELNRVLERYPQHTVARTAKAYLERIQGKGK